MVNVVLVLNIMTFLKVIILSGGEKNVLVDFNGNRCMVLVHLVLLLLCLNLLPKWSHQVLVLNNPLPISVQVSQTNARVRCQDASGGRRAIPVTRSQMIPSPAKVVNEESHLKVRSYSSSV